MFLTNYWEEQELKKCWTIEPIAKPIAKPIPKPTAGLLQKQGREQSGEIDIPAW